MRSCVENEVKQCFTGTDADDETIASVSQAIVMESLPEEDATVSLIITCIIFVMGACAESFYLNNACLLK